MSDNLAEAFNNIKKMVDSGNIPSEVQGLVNNLNNGNGDSKQALNNMLSQVSPEMLNNLSSMLQSNNTSNTSNHGSSSNSTSNSSNNINNTYKTFNNFQNNSNSSSGSNFNLDPETLMKMTSIINAMNQKDSASSNLLHSLKPYLRDSRKDKLDQYANLLNISKIADIMKNEKKENNTHG